MTRMLANQRFSSGAGAAQPPLVIAHGLFGSGRNWGVIAKRLSDSRPVITVDMRNHAGSFHDPDHSYPALARDLAQVIEPMDRPVHLLGHSMGGKAAMVLALTQPDLISRLIIADISPVAYTHSQVHHIEAMRAVDLQKISRRSDAAEQLAALGTAPELQSFFTQSLDVPNRRWLLNLDALAENMPNILGFPQISGTYAGPALFLSGANSDYVQPEHRAAIKALFPHARFAKIPGTGHWLHAEKPADVTRAIDDFLKDPAT